MNKLRLITTAIFFFLLCACFESCAGVNGPQHTKGAKQVLQKLNKTSRQKKPYFGHEDDLLYGQDWFITDSDSAYTESDVFSVSGMYPYVLGLDLGVIEKGGDINIDRCPFSKMVGAAKAHNRRGGVITISWHMTNPVTEGTAWDCSASNVVAGILNDSLLQKKYFSWLDKGADFFNQLVDDNGNLIPVLFRPFHECNMDGFWWSGKSCSDEEYVELWKLTFDYLVHQKKMYQLLWVYSPYDIKSKEELLSRYPGDEYVDVIGYERYQLGAVTFEEGAARFVEGVRNGLDLTIGFAKLHKKIVSFTETGFLGVLYDKWWTEALGKSIKNKRIAYVTVWRNGKSESYYFGPCLKSKSSDNFNEFVKNKFVKLLPR